MSYATEGFQVTFFAETNRHHGHTPMSTWLLQLAKSLGIRGATSVAASEGFGRHGRFHSAHFFELAEQPVEITIAMTAEQCDRLFAELEKERVDLFYVKSKVEFGRVGER